MAYKTIPFLRASNGLNNVVDPKRIAFDSEKGVVDLATAYNVDIDQSGRISRRPGLTLWDSWDSKNIFCDGGDCLFTSGTSLYKLNHDQTRTGLRSGLTPDLKMYYVQVGTKIYYANGVELGYVYNNLSWIWSASTYVGPTTTVEYSGPPDGITMLEVFKGRMYGAIGRDLFYSEPFSFGLFDLGKGFYRFSGDIRFIKAAYGTTDRDSDGLFVGTDYGVEFLEGDDPAKFSREQVSDSAPVIGTEVRCEGTKIGDGMPGKVVIWTAQNGIWVGGANGQAICVTRNRLKLPGALRGAAVYHDGKYIVLMQE